MDNLECAMAVLVAHREARQWDDRAVAVDLVAQLGLDWAGEAKYAKPVSAPGITEDEVLAHEAAAKEAMDKAAAARAELNAAKADAEKEAREAVRATSATLLKLPEDATQAQIDAAFKARDEAKAKDAAAKPEPEPVAKAEAPKPGVAGPMTSAQLDNPGKG